MNIDTRTIVSNSNNFQKRVKEAQSATRTEKVLEDNKVARQDGLEDFLNVTQTDSSFKRRIAENNARLTAYEDDFNQLEFLKQRLEMLESLDVKDQAQMAEIVQSSIYKGSNVFEKYSSDLSKVVDKLDEIKTAVSVAEVSLQEQYKAVEIANQNMLSLNTIDNDVSKISSLGNGALSDAFNLNNKRVIDLIS